VEERIRRLGLPHFSARRGFFHGGILSLYE
jgi:hypothetical protein